MPTEATAKSLTVQSNGHVLREVDELKSRGYIVGVWYPLDIEYPDGPWVIEYTELRQV